MWLGIITVFIKFYLILKRVDARGRNLRITISDLTEFTIFFLNKVKKDLKYLWKC